MNKKSISFWFLSLLLSFVLTNTACTKQNNNNETKSVDLALNKNVTSESENKVFPLSSVAKPTANKFVDFTYSIDGKEFSVAELAKGKYIFLNFWGTWCPPCRAEIPDIIEIQKELADKLIVIGVAMERPQDIAQARKLVEDYAENNKINYLNVVVSQSGTLRAKIAEAYGGIQFVPTTFLIDTDGNIVEKIQGGRSKEQFLESINKMIK